MPKAAASIMTRPQVNRGPHQGLPPTIVWSGDDDGVLELIDQTRLPHELVIRRCETSEQVWDAIKRLCVRGAPAIGVAGAYGLCLGTRAARTTAPDAFGRTLAEQATYLEGCRPTAVNLAWAIRRVKRVADAALAGDQPAAAAWQALLAEAHAIWAEDAAVCRRIGEVGAALIRDGCGVLTHCNAGALATVAYGTALAPLYVAHAAGRRFRIYADETRPLLQGMRLTAYELQAAGLDVTVLCDNAAAALLRSGRVDLVIVGADRIAANGDTANKIGTYGVALAARQHRVPFYVAAPTSTFDRTIPNGDAIPIEERAADEVLRPGGVLSAPAGVACYNPAFDVTPAELISGFLTERGLLEPVTERRIAEILGLGG